MPPPYRTRARAPPHLARTALAIVSALLLLPNATAQQVSPLQQAEIIAAIQSPTVLPAPNLAALLLSMSVPGLSVDVVNASAPSSASTAPCPQGHYCPFDPASNGVLVVLLCGAGAYRTDGMAASACAPCPPGFFCPYNASSPYPVGCLAGTYNPSAGASARAACLPCPPDATCLANCSTPLDHVCVATTGTYCLGQYGDPVTCEAGYYCPSGGSRTACPLNTFVAAQGSSDVSACAACASTQITDGTGAAACHDCTAGTYLSPGAAGAQQCLACAAGSSSGAAAAQCSPCAAGTYATPGSATCTQCRPGSYSASGQAPLCTACPNGTYTFTVTGSGASAAYTPVWGATALAQCVLQPTAPSHLVCFPGTFMLSAGCSACPVGYYCPEMTLTPGAAGSTVRCPNGWRSGNPGAMIASDCTVPGPVTPYAYSTCGMAPAAQLPSSYAGLSILAATAPLASDQSIVFATATAVYRLLLSSMSLQPLAGAEGAAGAAQGLASAARFTAVSALAVDLGGPQATVVLVGDAGAHTVTALDLYTNQVALLGSVGDVAQPGGIALRQDPASLSRTAYVSDTANNRILGFDVDTHNMMPIAGSMAGVAGSADGYYSENTMRAPAGLDFLEHSLKANRMLLVADSGNGLIRVLDTVDRSMTTWFAPLDQANPEMITPVALSVARDAAGDVLVYVVDTGFTPPQVGVIAYPFISSPTVRVLTVLSVAGGASAAALMPDPAILPSTFSVGQTELVYLDGATHTLGSLLQAAVAAEYTVAGACVYPCGDGGCPMTVQGLCGNFFLDAGEQCDDGGLATAGCTAACQINSTVTPSALTPPGTGWACPGGAAACLSPCVAYLHARLGTWHCAPDCLLETPAAGYAMNAACGEDSIDECELGTDDCSVYALCADTPGSFACACLTGYFGDGVACAATSYEVYTAVELPAVPRAAFAADTYAGGLVSAALSAAFAAALTATGPAGAYPPYALNVSALARLFTTAVVDPASTAATRLVLTTLFPDLATANAAATAAAANTGLAAALSAAISPTPGAVALLQGFTVQLHQANSFSAGVQQQGWGMNITSIAFNRTCTANGQAPANGCWQVELVYVGGSNLGTQAAAVEALNVLYIPRIDNAPVTNAPLYPTQALTMQSTATFPCSTTLSSQTGSIDRAATACCLQDVLSMYRPSSGLTAFLASSAYTTAVPAAQCATPAAITPTSPASDIVFQAPYPDGGSNDMVVGTLDGMPNSEVRLVQEIDFETRTFKVLLVLAQDDLVAEASLVQGATNVAYNSTFFVGLANFRGIDGSSVLQTMTMQQKVTVSKSNTLTLSSYGANQDPLVNYASLQLFSVKVTDYFAPPQYLYYLQPMFVLPANFAALPGASVVPLSSILIAKTVGGVQTTAWLQDCASADGTHVYADPALQTLVSDAQSQACVSASLAMCAPPINPSSVVQFGVPLPIGFLTDADFTNPAGVTVELQLMVVAYNPLLSEKVQTVLTLSLLLTPLGYTTVCSTLTASQTLQDVVDGNVYIGLASTDAEWNATVLKKTDFDQAGSTPAASFQFSTTSVQGAVMTFAALGDDAYFSDPRAASFGLNIYDMYTVHFLEPLGGAGGPTPNFDAALALFLAGTAFGMTTDAAHQLAWLTPSAGLLALCPYTPTYGKMACVTRVDSTIAGGTLKRAATFLELNTSASSVVATQDLVADVLGNGQANLNTLTTGAAFYGVLQDQLRFNNRYRKAYVVNPVLQWSYAAMQAQQPGSTPYTVCTKIIAVALITFQSATGGTQYRRMLTVQDNGAWVHPMALFRAALPPSLLAAALPDGRPGGRSLLQAAAGSLAATTTDASQAVGLRTAIPGMDAISSLCKMFGVPFTECGVASFTTTSAATAPGMQTLCASQSQGQMLQAQLGAFAPAATGLAGMVLVQYAVSGCPAAAAGAGGARRMLQATTNMVVTETQVLIHSVNGTVVIDVQKLNAVNVTLAGSILGGGTFVSFVPFGSPGAGVAPAITLTQNGSVIIIEAQDPGVVVYPPAATPATPAPNATSGVRTTPPPVVVRNLPDGGSSLLPQGSDFYFSDQAPAAASAGSRLAVAALTAATVAAALAVALAA